jgi:hypothetical protein
MKVLITSVEWDTEDPEHEGEQLPPPDLPQSFIIEIEDDEIEDDIEMLEWCLTDLISDAYGFFHWGYSYEVIKE